jgi:hypothetical protein
MRLKRRIFHHLFRLPHHFGILCLVVVVMVDGKIDMVELAAIVTSNRTLARMAIAS